MRNVNALEVRNKLGQILDDLERTKEPIFVSKGRRVRAVLITPEDFKRRFLDRQAEEQRLAILERVRLSRAPAVAGLDSLDELRRLRGYES